MGSAKGWYASPRTDSLDLVGVRGDLTLPPRRRRALNRLKRRCSLQPLNRTRSSNEAALEFQSCVALIVGKVKDTPQRLPIFMPIELARSP